ncbi:MAG: EF-hand domain-containing protein [Hellea sp.]
MFVKAKSLLLITSALLFSSAIHAAPEMDANGDDEITLDEYIAFQMADFNKRDKDFNGRVTAKETRNWQIEQNREHMKAAFKELDPDGNGRLTEDEYLEKTVSEMGGQFSMTQEVMEQAFDEMDSDSNGHISRLEYMAHQKQSWDDTLEMMKGSMLQQFKFMDKDSDGIVTEREFTGVVDDYGALLHGDTASEPDDAGMGFQESKRAVLDENGDGIITRTEQRQHSSYLFETLDSNNDSVITKQESPYLFNDSDGMAVRLDSNMIRR